MLNSNLTSSQGTLAAAVRHHISEKVQDFQLPPTGKKHDRGRYWPSSSRTENNLDCWDLSHLSIELTLAIRCLRTKPHLIPACFTGAGLSLQYGLAIYATLCNTISLYYRYCSNAAGPHPICLSLSLGARRAPNIALETNIRRTALSPTALPQVRPRMDFPI